MELKDVVKKLVGEIDPIGSSNVDEKRLENLKTMCKLVDELLMEICYVSREKDRHEHSRQVAGEYAHKFIHMIQNADE